MSDFSEYSLGNWPEGIIKIYCAGRIYSVESGDDYRDHIIQNAHDRFSPGINHDFYHSVRGIATCHPWAIYVGPYAFDDFSSGHGSGHRTFYRPDWTDADPELSDDQIEDMQVKDAMDRFYVAHHAKISIDAADIVVAVIDRESYGTILEVGYAVALGKTVLTVVEDDPELWFCTQGAGWQNSPNTLGRVCKDTDELIKTLWDRVDYLGYGKFVPETVAQLIESATSPLEKAFVTAAENHYHDTGEYRAGLKGQYPIPGTKYRADFADPELKAVVELDGHTYHSSKAAFNHDRQRQRTLEKLGWRVIRFTGDEVRGNPLKCVQESYEFLDQLAASKA